MDVAVVGSGAAGIAAAVSCGRQGLSTLLLDSRPGPGGTGGLSGLTTLCGCYNDSGRMLNNGFAREFAERLQESDPLKMGRVWVLPYRPERFRQIAEMFLNETPNIHCQWNTPLGQVTAHEGQIHTINEVRVGAVIDCTGTAELARALGLPCMETTPATQAPAVVFPLGNVARDLSTAAPPAQVLLPLARAGFPPLTFQPNLEPASVTVKFSGPIDQAGKVIEFLRSN